MTGSRAIALLLLFGAAAAAAPTAPPNSPAPAAEDPFADLRKAAADGLTFLLSAQNEDGSFGYHAQTSPYMIYAPIPGGHRAFKAGTTGLCLMALRAAPPGDERVGPALGKGLSWLIEHGRAKRSTGDEMYAVWAWTYGLTAAARCMADPVEGISREALAEYAAWCVKALEVHQTLDGGWTYFDFFAQTRRPSDDSMSFITAGVLLALHEAAAQGVEIPPAMLRNGLRSLRRCRTPEKTYVYSYRWRMHPAGGINRPQGSLTRKPACDLALFLHRAGATEEDLAEGVANFVEKKAFSRMALHRPVPHESWFAVSGYFHLFGVMHAAEACRRLPAATADRHRRAILEEAMATRHPDGSFWDYPLYGYHKPYGTAYALLAFAALLPAQT